MSTTNGFASQGNGDEPVHRVSSSFTESMSNIMPLQNFAGRKVDSFPENDSSAIVAATEIPAAMEIISTAWRQEAELHYDGEPHPHGKVLKPPLGTAAESTHLEKIWEWNSNVPISVEQCVSDLIGARVQAQPNAPAVCAWDGELTYSQLDRLAAKLASRLCRLGVGSDIFVPLCFEKSMWTTVAVLGVIKAGGAFVLLDSSLPEQRLQVIIHQLQADVVLSSTSNGEMSSRMAKQAIVINWEFFTAAEIDGIVPIDHIAQNLHPANPQSLLYAVFTSGSTGMPKGVLITNANAASALHHQAEAMGMSKDSRIFDFASYSFDVSVSNVLSALSTGGCLCVPSEEDRKDNLEHSIASLKANILDITPSMAQVLSPDRIPSVHTLIFGGEALHLTDIRRWWDKVRIIHIYGPCECTPTSTINHGMADPDDAVYMGKGVGLVTWIVDPEDHNILLPPGCTGELLLEGPLVGRGYLNDDAKTAAAFIKDPVWLLRGSSTKSGRRGRLYKTGDLAKYENGGYLKFVGRKQATQVKIRGQRLELGEIEHTLRSHAIVDEAVAALQHEDGQEPRIVSFVTVRDGDMIGTQKDNTRQTQQTNRRKAEYDSQDTEYTPMADRQGQTDRPLTNGMPRNESQQKVQEELYAMLKTKLPSYMVPQVIEILDSMPLNRNGKIDRLELVKNLNGRAPVRGPTRQPVLDAERQMLHIWAQVLNIDRSGIGSEDNFFHLGGSSITAMKVVAEARKFGIKVSVADIFRHPVLHELVDRSHRNFSAAKPDRIIEPFSLLSDVPALNSVLEELCIQYQLGRTGETAENAKFIQDAYPCTPLQEGLMSLTSMSPGSYIGQSVLELSPNTSIEKLRMAWEEVVRGLPILRSRLVHHDRVGLVQIVVDEPLHWAEADCLEDYLQSDIEQPMDLGQPLSRYALVKDGSMGPLKWFVWTIHHALYDGWSMPLIIDAVRKTYLGEPFRQGPQFQAFVHYVNTQDSKIMKDYWLNALDGYECAPFPSLPRHIEHPIARNSIETSFQRPGSNHLGITPPVMIRAAWALLIGKMTGADDVVFGVTLFGRNAPLSGIEIMAGPTFATVPVRVKWSDDDSAIAYLKAVQQQATEMIAYEQIGLHKLTELSPGARQACMFQTLLIVQPEEDVSDASDELGTWKSELGRGDKFDTYGLMLIVRPVSNTVNVSASFDSRMIEPWWVEKLLSRLGHVVAQLDQANPELLLSDIQTVAAQDLEQIWKWNSTVPTAVEQCVHKLFEETAAAQPQASAVCAWDGNWTYSELHQVSTRLAHYLVSLGVRSEFLVPLCFEKSRWTPVAMLAVMKAGGTFVALDSTQPEKRLRTIVQQTEPALVLLTSLLNQELASRLSRQHAVVVIDDSLLANLNSTAETNSQLPVVSPSDKLYIAFTSGSTGVPKGAIITHSNFSSAIHHLRNSSSSGIEPTARVYDFASYAFDISLLNNLQSLTSGACLCIPSEADRRDDLAGSIHRFRATFVILTPSTANLLPLETIHSLETLMLAGEALPSECARRWVGLTRLKNGYGPCECTPITTVAAIGEDNIMTSSIGKGVGVNTWVVQATNHENLVPIGDIGELVLEGPLVGSGYLGDAEQTAAAFIQSPRWLLQGAPGHSGRQGYLYKTGDLVRHTSNGSLIFIGRKDNDQVKIRGQRVELGDVESHVYASFPAARQVTAEVILPTDEDGQGRPTLAVFIIHDRHTETAASPTAQIISVPAEVDHELAKRLPSYMVPTVYISLNKLPINSSGKIDRRLLREIGAGITLQQLAQLRSATAGEKRAPATEIERKLQEIWARVLGIDTASIGIDDSFFRLGGDSITAMQASAAARGLGISMSTAEILRSKTICLLAATSSSSKHHVTDVNATDAKGDDGQPFDLSPIQRLYVSMQPDPNHCFDQSFFLKLREPISFAALSIAIETVVKRHSMLRARFSQTGKGVWKQRISEDVFGSFHLSEVVDTISASPSKARDIRQCRERLNIETGPITGVVLFNNSEAQSLFISVHHLVIDLVSWRILLDELEDLFMGRQLSPSPTTSFRTWCSLQTHYAKENLQEEGRSQAKTPQNFSYWDVKIEENIHAATTSKEFMLDEGASRAILGACNEAFGTRPAELMIAALVYSFSTVFSDRPLPMVFSEGHGRESWDDHIDLSRIIGWFTTISPASVLNGASLDLEDIICFTKDTVRMLPKNGWSYFTSKFSNQISSELNAADYPVEILFNFAGSYQQLERDDSFFENLSTPTNCHPESWSRLRRLALFEFNAHIDKHRLAVSLDYPKKSQHDELIETWLASYKATLTHLGSLLSNKPSEWTLSDFPLAFTSYSDMHKFRSVVLPQIGLGKPQDIEDIFPCTGLQEGLLVAQFKSPNNYQVVLDYEIIATETPGDYVDLLRIKRAWQAVVKRHAILRSVLVDVMPGSSRTMHIVLKDPTPSITLNESTREVGEDDSLRGRRARLKYKKYDLQHHLSVSRIDNRHVHICLELSHVILDGHSTGVMLNDFWQAYNGASSLIASSYGDYIKYLEKQPRDADREFWVKHLEGVEPCLFPTSKSATGQTMKDVTASVPGLDASMIHKFCSELEVTTATLIQTAWALVLYHYTGCASPCFGNLASCRDAPIEGIADMFGPVICMVPYRVRLDRGRSVAETLREAQKDYADSLPHQTLSLMQVNEAFDVGTSGFFNTILSFQRAVKQPLASIDGHIIQEQGAHDPVEYPISISVSDSDTEISIDMTFKAGFLPSTEASRVAKAIGAAILSMISEPHDKVTNVSLLARDDLEQLWSWNSLVPAEEEKCAHSLIEEQTMLRPEAVAISARDGELTYKELDRLANSLARQLESMGIGPGVTVPLCFEKSVWTPVAALSVLKAGGSFALLDPSIPEQRLQSMVQQLGASILLSSSLHSKLSSRLSKTILQVGPGLAKLLESLITDEPSLPPGTPSAPMYIVFTSGSTGTPKGVVLSHTNFCSGLKHQSHLLGYNQDSRVFDFASYAFDISVHNMFATLATGGCLCIPTAQERQDNVTKSIADFKATLVDVTPSVARLIDPSAVPDLETMILAGEAVSIDDANRWWNKARVVNAYGPAESTIISTINWRQSCAEEAISIGKGAGTVTWVVDPENHDSLLPLGCVGELLLEGPLVGCGYLGDTDMTDVAFIRDPKWLLAGVPGKQKGRHGRLYKSGDLVRYNADGSLVFVRRKQDTQVKIRGQRVELGEIEGWVQKYMPQTAHVIAEVIKPRGGEDLSSMSLLAIFVQPKDEKLNRNVPNVPVEILPIPAHVEGELAKYLPAYMVPSLLFSMSKLPMTVTGKIDRKQLRELGAQFSNEQLAKVRTAGCGLKQQPTSEAERLMQTVWAKVLNLDVDIIGLDDSFFHLGGDSISSMRLVSEARKLQINLTVADVFHHETLKELARGRIRNELDTCQQHPAEEAVLVDASTRETLLEEVESLGLNIGREDVADILPVTNVQERCFVEGMYPVMCAKEDNRDYSSTCGRFANYIYVDLSAKTDISLLEKACTQTLIKFPILRACFLQLQGKFWQVVLRTIGLPFQVRDVTDNLDIALHNFCLTDAHEVTASQPPISLMLLRHHTDGMRLTIRISHAQYDGICLPTIVQSFIGIGTVTAPAPPEFSTFLSYASSRRSLSIAYWKKLLQDSQPFSLRRHLPVQAGMENRQPEAIHVRAETTLPCLPSKITPATLVSAAWAVLLWRLTGLDDVIYGHLVAGRNSAIEGIEEMVGCCVDFIPVRVRLTSSQTAAELLLCMQEQFLAVEEADSLGYQEIIKSCTDWPVGTSFESTIQHQNIVENPLIQTSDGASQVQFFQNPHSVPMSIHLFSETQDGKLYFDLNSNTQIMSTEAAKAMVDGLVLIVENFKTDINASLSSWTWRENFGLLA